MFCAVRASYKPVAAALFSLALGPLLPGAPRHPPAGRCQCHNSVTARATLRFATTAGRPARCGDRGPQCRGSVSEAVYRTVDKRGHFAAPSQPRSVAESPYWGKACTTGEAKVAAPNCPRQGPPPETIPSVERHSTHVPRRGKGAPNPQTLPAVTFDTAVCRGPKALRVTGLREKRSVTRAVTLLRHCAAAPASGPRRRPGPRSRGRLSRTSR
jgi:hypothetical protein